MFGRRGRERHDDLSYVFVVTYGRSGSTLLAGVLNSIPGYLIRGENRDALHHLFLFHQTLVAERERVGQARGRQRTHPFFGIGDVPLDRSLRGIRKLVLDTVLRPRKDTRVTGFKEIRWYHPDLEEYVAWLREVFPGARFLVNTRSHDDVLKSKWWAEGGDKSLDLQRIELRLLALADSLGDAAYHVHYDDYVADPAVLRGMFEWLGEPWDEEAVRAVMARKYSV
jgi:hypothetical protein